MSLHHCTKPQRGPTHRLTRLRLAQRPQSPLGQAFTGSQTQVHTTAYLPMSRQTQAKGKKTSSCRTWTRLRARGGYGLAPALSRCHVRGHTSNAEPCPSRNLVDIPQHLLNTARSPIPHKRPWHQPKKEVGRLCRQKLQSHKTISRHHPM